MFFKKKKKITKNTNLFLIRLCFGMWLINQLTLHVKKKKSSQQHVIVSSFLARSGAFVWLELMQIVCMVVQKEVLMFHPEMLESLLSYNI